MENGSMKLAIGSAAIAALVLCVAGGVVHAAIPDASGVIHACYATKDGLLRVIDTAAGQTCDAKKEIALSWSQTGPQGEMGLQGVQGPPGPSNAYTNFGAADFQRIGEGLTQTVASVTLPAGSYTLAATVTGTPVGDARFASCYFVSAATVQGHAALISYDDYKHPLIGQVTIATDNTAVFLRCTALDGDFDLFGELIATRVGTITPSL